MKAIDKIFIVTSEVLSLDEMKQFTKQRLEKVRTILLPEHVTLTILFEDGTRETINDKTEVIERDHYNGIGCINFLMIAAVILFLIFKL